MARFSSLVWVVCENHGFHQVKDLTSHQRLAAEGSLLTNYFSVGHPSGPNYRSMASGEMWSSKDLFGEQKPTFASESGLPVTVWNFKGKPARRHNPFADLISAHETADEVDLEALPERCLLYVGLDDNNNGHSGPLAVADKNLNELLDRLSASEWWKRPVNGLYPALFLTWDEAYTQSNQVFAAFYGLGVQAGGRSDAKLDHYNFCRLCCENFETAPLGKAATREPISGIFIE